jgi:hypothetical protein
MFWAFNLLFLVLFLRVWGQKVKNGPINCSPKTWLKKTKNKKTKKKKKKKTLGE